MMAISDPVLSFDYEKATDIEKYERQIKTLLKTVEGTCPGDRAFGLSNEYQDEPPEVAKVSLSLEIYNKMEEYIPRLEVLEIDFSFGEEGELIPCIRFGPNEDYEEDEDEENDD